jgi:hypothetical protein
MTAKAEKRYRVFHTEEEANRSVEIGVVTLSDDHRLQLISAVRGRREFLERLVRELNGAKVIHVIAPPPPEADRRAIYTRPVERSDAGFREAFTERLNRDYGIELKPT